jgi:hypothetical protein
MENPKRAANGRKLRITALLVNSLKTKGLATAGKNLRTDEEAF